MGDRKSSLDLRIPQTAASKSIVWAGIVGSGILEFSLKKHYTEQATWTFFSKLNPHFLVATFPNRLNLIKVTGYNPNEFLVWRYLKSNLYVNKPENLDN